MIIYCHMNTTIHLATDHAGFEMKEFLKEALTEMGYHVIDYGAFVYDEDDDYPDYISQAAFALAQGDESDRAILLGGSGQGEAMMANRFVGVRATAYYHFSPEILKTSREHNNANALSIGARFLSEEEVIESVLFWLEKDFEEEERHQRRIAKLDEMRIEGEDYDE